MNFTVIKTEDISFGHGQHFAKVYVKCNSCQKKFYMGYVGTMNGDGTWNKKYEYKYCPHCAKDLNQVENK